MPAPNNLSDTRTVPKLPYPITTVLVRKVISFSIACSTQLVCTSKFGRAGCLLLSLTSGFWGHSTADLAPRRVGADSPKSAPPFQNEVTGYLHLPIRCRPVRQLALVPHHRQAQYPVRLSSTSCPFKCPRGWLNTTLDRRTPT